MDAGLIQRLPVVRRRAARFPIAGTTQPPSPEPRRVGVVPHGARRAAAVAARAISEAVDSLGWPPARVYPTTPDSFGSEQARTALDDGCDLVIACGGDGTVRMVAQTLRHTGVPLGIVPTGTANIFARNLLLPLHSTDRAIATALHGAEAMVDLGVALTTSRSLVEEHIFLVLAGIGNDAATVQGTHDTLKSGLGPLGWLAYAESAARHALRPPAAMTVRYPGEDARQVRAWSVIAGSCGKVPGGVEVFPGAVIDDGLLDVLEVSVTNPLQWVPIAAKGLLHLRSEPSGLRHRLSAAVMVESEDPLPVQLDGDVVTGVTRLEISTDHRAITVRIAPPTEQ